MRDLINFEGFYFPEALRSRFVTVIGRIENIMEPALGLREVPVAAEMQSEREWDVIKDLPIVNRIGALGVIEVEVFDRQEVSNQIAVKVKRLRENRRRVGAEIGRAAQSNGFPGLVG